MSLGTEKKKKETEDQSSEKKKVKRWSKVAAVGPSMCVYLWKCHWVMSFENWKQPQKSENWVIETELWKQSYRLAKQPFCYGSHHFWVMSYGNWELSYQIWLAKQPLRFEIDLFFLWFYFCFGCWWKEKERFFSHESYFFIWVNCKLHP